MWRAAVCAVSSDTTAMAFTSDARRTKWARADTRSSPSADHPRSGKGRRLSLGLVNDTSPRADLGRRCIKAETVLRNLGEEIGIAPRHQDVVQRAYTPCRVNAHSHQEAGSRTSDLLERQMHANLVIAVISRRDQPRRGICTDDKCGVWKQARLLGEGGRSSKFHRRFPG